MHRSTQQLKSVYYNYNSNNSNNKNDNDDNVNDDDDDDYYCSVRCLLTSLYQESVGSVICPSSDHRVSFSNKVRRVFLLYFSIM